MKCKVILERLNARQFFSLPLAQPDTTELMNETAADIVQQLLTRHPELSSEIIGQLADIEGAVVQAHQRFIEERNVLGDKLTGLQAELASIQKAITAKREEIGTLERELEDVTGLPDTTAAAVKIRQLAKQAETLGRIRTAITRYPDGVHQMSTVPGLLSRTQKALDMVKALTSDGAASKLTGVAARDFEEHRETIGNRIAGTCAPKDQKTIAWLLQWMENFRIITIDSQRAAHLKHILRDNKIRVDVATLDKGILPPELVMSPDLLSMLIPFSSPESADVLREALHLISLNRRTSVFTEKHVNQLSRPEPGRDLRGFLAPMIMHLEQARFDLTRRMGIARGISFFAKKLGSEIARKKHHSKQTREEALIFVDPARQNIELAVITIGPARAVKKSGRDLVEVLQLECAAYSDLAEKNARTRYAEQTAAIIDRIDEEIRDIEGQRDALTANQESALSKQRGLISLQASLSSLEEDEAAVIKNIEEAKAVIGSAEPDNALLEVFEGAIQELEEFSPKPDRNIYKTTPAVHVKKAATGRPDEKPLPEEPLPDSWEKVDPSKTYTISIKGAPRKIRFTPGLLHSLVVARDAGISAQILGHLQRGNVNKSPNGEAFPYSVTVPRVTKALFGRDGNGDGSKYILFEKYEAR